MLEAHPKLVHFHKVGQDEADGVLQIALGSFAIAGRQVVAGLS